MEGVAAPPPVSLTTGQFYYIFNEQNFTQCLVNASSDLAGNGLGCEKHALASKKTCQSSSTTIAGWRISKTATIWQRS